MNSTRTRTERMVSPRRRHVVIAAVILAVYLGLDWALRGIAVAGSGIIALYPGAGLALAFLLVTGPRGAAVLLVARLSLFGADRLLTDDLPILVIEAMLQVGAYTVAAEIIRRRVLAGLDAWRIKHAVWLMAASTLPAVFAALVAATQLAWTRGAGPAFWRNVLTFAAADIAGTLVVLPAALLALRHVLVPSTRTKSPAVVASNPARRQQLVERLVATLVVVATIAAGVVMTRDQADGFAYLQLICILPVAWVAIREGFDGAVFVIAGYGLAWTLLATSLGFAQLPVVDVQASLLTLAVVGLLLGAARTESAESSAQYWHMLASAGEGVWRVDPHGKSLYLNDQMLRMLGVPGDQVIGREVRDFIHPDDRERWESERSQRAEGKDALYEIRLLRPDGTTRLALVRASVARNARGEAIGAVAIVTDITALREAEASRRRAQVLLEAAFHSSREGMILFRARDEMIIDVNDLWCQIVGYRRDEVIGRTVRELRLWGDAADSVRMAEAIREHGSVRDFEFPFNRRLPDGTTERGYALVSAAPVADGDETFLLVAGRDTTLERRREAAERQLRRLEELGRLAGSISHDFNNLLTVVLGYSQLAKMELDPASDVAADLDEIERAAQRGQHLTRRLLAFSRSQPVETRVVDVRESIEHAHGMLRSAIGPAVTLKIEHAGDDLRILADPSQIDQILLNLAMNARDAMSGSGTLTIRTSSITALPGRVADTVGPGALPGDYVLLEISDTGVGMDERTQARIFEPFFTTKSSEEGTGLGLAVVFGIVRQAHGAVRVASAPGRGARFSIFWPVAAIREMPVPDAEAKRSAEAPGVRGARIVLVEDDDMVRRIVTRILEDAGYEVYGARNGIRGILCIDELASIGKPAALVVSDVVMPEMGGRKLAEHLLRERPELPVVLLSGHVGTEDDLRAGLPNVRELMMKPFEVSALLDVVVRALTDRPHR
ncbi:MAG TPA: PAS domain S-box protein [Gemmatimonadaceae bacterium]|nr:PAS domain S-box protein [Gemmatimonadaceae bacterium]